MRLKFDLKPNSGYTTLGNMITKKQSQKHEISLLGSKVKYWVYGSEQPETILMIHGFSGNHRGFAKIIGELDDYRLIVPDLPGFGSSSPMSELSHNTEGYAEFVEHFIQSLRLKKPPILLGHSFGSVISARIAAAHPELIDERLILLSPISSSPLSSASLRGIGARLGEAHYWSGQYLPKVGTKILKSHIISRTATFTLTKTQDKNLRREIYDHHLSDLDFLNHKDIFYEAYRSLNRDGIVNYAPYISQKTLMIAGAADTMWPKQTQQYVKQKIKNAQLILLPQVGHLTHFESPVFIASEIRKFLGEKRSNRSTKKPLPAHPR